jgi:hypothetical protein
MSPKKYSERELIDALLRLAERLGRAPSAIDAGDDPQSPASRTYQHHFGSWLGALEAAGIEPEPSQTGYSREELLESLRDLAGRLGYAPRQVDVDKDLHTPSSSTYRRHFGSWLKALEAAGIQPGPAQTGYSCDELLDGLRELARELGRAPTGREMSAREDLPHASTYWKRFGSWNAAVRAAGLIPRRVSSSAEDEQELTDA